MTTPDTAPTPERVEEWLKWIESGRRITPAAQTSLCRSWLAMRVEVERLKLELRRYGWEFLAAPAEEK